MYFQEFYYWCRDAVRKIKYIPDRNKVYLELRNHMEDRYQDLLERGVSPKEAERQTLAAMGDANEVADMLAAIHKPFWGYALVLTRFLATVLFCLAIGNGIYYFHEEYYSRGKELRPFGDGRGERIVSCQPNVSDYSDGYTLRITEAGVWRERLPAESGEEDFQDQLILRLKVTNLLPWAPEQRILSAMWAVDSNGVYHDGNMWRATETDTGYIGVIQSRRENTTWYYDIWFSNTSEDLKWIELHYDRDGRDVVLRVDLSEEGSK